MLNNDPIQEKTDFDGPTKDFTIFFEVQEISFYFLFFIFIIISKTKNCRFYTYSLTKGKCMQVHEVKF